MKLTIDQVLQQAVDAHKEGKLDEAEHLYKNILKTDPTHPDANHNFGILTASINKNEESLQLFKIATEVNPSIEQFWISRINALVKEKLFEEAEIISKKGIKYNPRCAGIYYNLGIIQHTLEKFQDAKKNYKKVIELEPGYSHAYNNLGITLKDMGKVNEAEVSYRKAIELDPNYVEAHNNLGYILYNLNRKSEAIASFSKSIELRPNFKPSLLARGKILFDKEEFEKSLKDFDSCNNEESRARALASLYYLGRIDEIYKRIETNSELDKKNVGVAAFSAFITEKEKKETAHKFCNNPMDFMYFSNLSDHVNDCNSFITEVIEDLQKVKTTWEPIGKTTYKGFHSDKKINVFNESLKKINDLKLIIINEIDQYRIKFKDEKCSFIKKWPTEKNLFGWHIVLKHQGYQITHIHPGAWLSGVIYLKVVPDLEKNEGAIEFSLNGQYYSDPKSKKIIHQPKIGDIVLFPPSLHHKTIPFTTDTDRIIISFNLLSN